MALRSFEDEQRREGRPWPAERANVAGRGTRFTRVVGSMHARRIRRDDRRGAAPSAAARRGRRDGVERVRRSLVVGPAGDAAELEADRVAQRVVAALSGGTPELGVEGGSLAPSARAADGSTRIRRTSAAIGPEGGALDAETSRRIGAARGGGARIQRSLVGPLESAFGTSLEHVRLHAGHESRDLNQRLGAAAFTVGDDVFFRDGLPAVHTRAGMGMLAHELAHTMQRDPAAGARRIVRRLLVPEAAAAFATAAAANSSFDQARIDTDQLAAPPDQTTLTTTRSWLDWSNETDESRRITDMVRAVVLREYSTRLRALETANDADGNPLSAAAKTQKCSVYLTKAKEFRDKHVPLIAAGAASPETRAFLRGHGLSTEPADPNSAVPGVVERPARIDVRATFIGAEVLGMRMRAHLFIVYTAPNGRQMFFRGGPGAGGMTVAHMGDYTTQTVDWDPSAPSVTVLEGPEAEQKLDALQEATLVIDQMKVPYRAQVGYDFGETVPGALLSVASGLLSSAGENCNATAYTILTRAGVPIDKPSGRHPGWGSILGTWTEGKQNALPPVEAMAAAKPYVIDASRDAVKPGGEIPVFADRAMFKLLFRLPERTAVEVLEERPNSRRISHGGQVGYIPRRAKDAQLAVNARFMRLLREKYSAAELQQVVDDPTNTALQQKITNEIGIPPDSVLGAVQLVLKPGGAERYLLRVRLENMGFARLHELVDDPAEAEWLADKLGVDTAVVAQQAAALVGEEDRLTTALAKRLTQPEAASLAVNELPDYPTIRAIAKELGKDADDVFRDLDRRRPKEHRGEFLRDILQSDPRASGAQAPPADALQEWADTLGVPVQFVAKRFQAIAAAKRLKEQRKRVKLKPVSKQRYNEIFGACRQRSNYDWVALRNDPKKLWPLVNDFPDFAELSQLTNDWGFPIGELRTVLITQYRPHPKAEDLTTVLDGFDPAMIAAYALARLSQKEGRTMLLQIADRTQLPIPYVDPRIRLWHQLHK